MSDLQHHQKHKKRTLEIENRTSDQEHEAVEEEEDEEGEIEDLERQVGEMAEKIIHFRTTVPDLLKETLESSLIARRPFLPQIDLSQASVTSDRNHGAGANIELSNQALLEEEDPETAAKICLLKSKISSNVSAMPVILKRMNECITAIDKLDRCNVDIHPAFKRRRKQ
ncbi:hypothetical protein MRB53_032417 [Persea americana]|uniref:Uncharacterized protein n=1 Tax=Persea americana TaxID=3435 RepID=A0ACC2KS45_PERAE|nr:hypothetical protein MRB53_032417 [Persea americana]